MPHDDELRKAAAVINAGSKVAMLVGAGAKGARAELEQVADLLGAGAAKALLGKQVLPDTLDWVTGSIGLLGTKPSWELMTECDTLLMVGTSFPYSEFLPEEGKARGVQIDIDQKMLGIRYPNEVNLAGDAADTLRRLIPLLERNEDRSWRETVESNVRKWRNVITERAGATAHPINPQRVFSELSPKLPSNVIITSDSGSSANWYARNLVMRDGMLGSLSGNLATMGAGVPYAIGAKFTHPDRPVIALVGDGAMQMNGNGELVTVAKYWKRWSDPRLIVMVLNNQDLNQVTWEQRIMAGDPRFDASQDLPDFPYAEYAKSIGLSGVRVDDPEQLGDAWDRALRSDRPFILEAITDPDVPPLPPHITFKQAKGFMFSTPRDSHRDGIIVESAKQIWDTVHA